MPKLGSKKSRGGCTNCKRRRVKCDEAKPTCANCAKYKMGCMYITGSNEHEYATVATRTRKTSAASSPVNGDSNSATGRRHQGGNSLSVLADAVSSVEASNHPATVATPPEANAFHISSTSQTPFSFTLLDLELLHNFTVTTYETIARTNTYDVWRVHVPKLAYTREWLMRGVIAISAMHEASDYAPDPHRTSELVQLALTSMNAGLPNLNHLVDTISLDDTESCSAIAAYTALVAMYALAMPSLQYFTSVRLGLQDPGEPLEDPLGQLLHNFELIRGTAEVYRKVWATIQKGPMAPVTDVKLFSEDVLVSPDFEEIFGHTPTTVSEESDEPERDELRRQLLARTRLVGKSMNESIQDEDVKTPCMLAYQHLYLVVKKELEPDEDINRGILLAWPAILTPAFMRLLRDHHPPALSCLALWALLLKYSSWLTRGWKRWIIDALHDVRNKRQERGEDVNNVWWDTVVWAAELKERWPRFLDEGVV